jgi:hypothetical protein
MEKTHKTLQLDCEVFGQRNILKKSNFNKPN